MHHGKHDWKIGQFITDLSGVLTHCMSVTGGHGYCYNIFATALAAKTTVSQNINAVRRICYTKYKTKITECLFVDEL